MEVNYTYYAPALHITRIRAYE